MDWKGMQLVGLKLKFISRLVLFSQFSVSPHNLIWTNMTEGRYWRLKILFLSIIGSLLYLLGFSR